MAKMIEKTPKITQIGIIVRDGEKIMKTMSALFGLEPSRIRDTKEDDARRYYGKPGDFKAHLIYYMFHDVEVEFVVPTGGTSIWQDFLDEHGEGLHHIQFAVEDCDETAAELAEHGGSVMQEGTSVSNIPGAKWQYYDMMSSLGLIIEAFDGVAKAAKMNNK